MQMMLAVKLKVKQVQKAKFPIFPDKIFFDLRNEP